MNKNLTLLKIDIRKQMGLVNYINIPPVTSDINDTK